MQQRQGLVPDPDFLRISSRQLSENRFGECFLYTMYDISNSDWFISLTNAQLLTEHSAFDMYTSEAVTRTRSGSGILPDFGRLSGNHFRKCSSYVLCLTSPICIYWSEHFHKFSLNIRLLTYKQSEAASSTRIRVFSGSGTTVAACAVCVC